MIDEKEVVRYLKNTMREDETDMEKLKRNWKHGHALDLAKSRADGVRAGIEFSIVLMKIEAEKQNIY